MRIQPVNAWNKHNSPSFVLEGGNRIVCKFGRNGGIKLSVQNESFRKIILGCAPLIEEANLLLPKPSRIKSLVISNHSKRAYSPRKSEIISDPTILAPHYPVKMFIQHELSHAYFDNAIMEMERKSVEEAYTRLTNGLVERRNGRGGLECTNVKWAEPSYRYRILQFKESTYLPRVWKSMGHPWDSAGELFSSASAILRFLHVPFFKRLEKFGKKGEVHTLDVLEAAKSVVLAWGKAKLFPNAVYDKLGL